MIAISDTVRSESSHDAFSEAKQPEKAVHEKPKTAKPVPATHLPSAASVSRATPLERPVSAVFGRTAIQREKPVQSIKRDQAEKPAYPYADLLNEPRKARRPLSTGNDRF